MYSIFRAKKQLIKKCYKIQQHILFDLECKVSPKIAGCYRLFPYFLSDGISYEVPKHLVIKGLINSLWQEWNRFWKVYWLAYLLGGHDADNNVITPLGNFISQSHAVYYVLHLLNKRPSPQGTIRGSYEEPTWGAYNVIQGVSSRITNPTTPPASTVTSAINTLGSATQHFHKVRNVAVHPDSEGMHDIICNVAPYYIISTLKYPTDIVLSMERHTGDIAINYWVDTMIGFANLI